MLYRYFSMLRQNISSRGFGTYKRKDLVTHLTRAATTSKVLLKPLDTFQGNALEEENIGVTHCWKVGMLHHRSPSREEDPICTATRTGKWSPCPKSFLTQSRGEDNRVRSSLREIQGGHQWPPCLARQARTLSGPSSFSSITLPSP